MNEIETGIFKNASNKRVRTWNSTELNSSEPGQSVRSSAFWRLLTASCQLGWFNWLTDGSTWRGWLFETLRTLADVTLPSRKLEVWTSSFMLESKMSYEYDDLSSSMEGSKVANT